MSAPWVTTAPVPRLLQLALYSCLLPRMPLATPKCPELLLFFFLESGSHCGLGDSPASASLMLGPGGPLCSGMKTGILGEDGRCLAT